MVPFSLAFDQDLGLSGGRTPVYRIALQSLGQKAMSEGMWAIPECNSLRLIISKHGSSSNVLLPPTSVLFLPDW